MWDKPPHAEILINDQSMFDGDITGTEDQPNLITFTYELEEEKEYDLIIKRTGKTKGQTVVNDKGDIIQDQLLKIKNITIDEIDIGGLVYEGVYTPEYPEPWATQQAEAGKKLPKSFTNCTILGHNGTWTLTAQSPLYMWLLENLY